MPLIRSCRLLVSHSPGNLKKINVCANVLPMKHNKYPLYLAIFGSEVDVKIAHLSKHPGLRCWEQYKWGWGAELRGQQFRAYTVFCSSVSSVIHFFTRREYNKFIPTSLWKETHCNQAIFIQFCKKKKPSVHCIICVSCLYILILPLKSHLLIATVPTRSVMRNLDDKEKDSQHLMWRWVVCAKCQNHVGWC